MELIGKLNYTPIWRMKKYIGSIWDIDIKKLKILIWVILLGIILWFLYEPSSHIICCDDGSTGKDPDDRGIFIGFLFVLLGVGLLSAYSLDVFLNSIITSKSSNESERQRILEEAAEAARNVRLLREQKKLEFNSLINGHWWDGSCYRPIARTIFKPSLDVKKYNVEFEKFLSNEVSYREELSKTISYHRFIPYEWTWDEILTVFVHYLWLVILLLFPLVFFVFLFRLSKYWLTKIKEPASNSISPSEWEPNGDPGVVPKVDTNGDTEVDTEVDTKVDTKGLGNVN